MNSSGFIRTLMVKAMDNETFLIRIMDTIAKEFEKEAFIVEILDGMYSISMGGYYTILEDKEISELKQIVGPYQLDRYILDEFKNQGMEFSLNRSQYICYVYGNFELDEEGNPEFPDFDKE